MPDLDPEERALRQKTLSGDIAHRFHKLVTAHFPECWEEMGEAEQRDFNAELQAFALKTAVQAIDLAAGAGIKPMAATIKRITIEDGVKMALELPALSEEEVHALVGARRQTIKLIGPAVRAFQGDVEPLPVAKDQPDLVEDVIKAGNGADEPERQAGMGPEEAAEVARVWAVQDAARREAEGSDEGRGEDAGDLIDDAVDRNLGLDPERRVPRFEPAPEEELERQEPRPKPRRTRRPNTGVYRHETAPA